MVTEILDVLFKDGHIANDFQIASGWSNGGVFDCIWTDNNIRFEDGVMKLIIDKMTSGNYKYSGAEYRTTEYYSYGLYEVEMKPIKNIGVVSSFFTYTGPSDNNPWDEIDIEFLGKDTTKVQFNYYTNGRGNHEYMYNLGFDASEEFHKYAFLWEEGKITWYVDGVAVHTAYNNIPVTPGKIMMNVWPGINVDGWLGRYDGNTPLTAEYKSMKFTPIDKL
ncbi:MAG: glycosyl hydrolase family protein [Ruminococcus sp.]|nr:glycosyl hydrolase family protein [Ruminococcus sp.]